MGFWEIEILHFMQKVLAFLEASPVSVVFSLFLLVAALLNIFRCWLISWEKKQVSQLETCKFLLLGKKSRNVLFHLVSRASWKEKEVVRDVREKQLRLLILKLKKELGLKQDGKIS